MDYIILVTDREGNTWVDDVLYGGHLMSPDFVASYAEERAHHGRVEVVESTTARRVLVINPDVELELEYADDKETC